MRRSLYRERILELMEDGQHRTAKEIFEILHAEIPALSLVTVYRNLDALEKAGKVRRILLGEETLWERRNRPPHLHFQCRVCGRLVDLPVDISPLAKHAAPVGTVEAVHGVVEGVCHSCRRNGNEEAP